MCIFWIGITCAGSFHSIYNEILVQHNQCAKYYAGTHCLFVLFLSILYRSFDPLLLIICSTATMSYVFFFTNIFFMVFCFFFCGRGESMKRAGALESLNCFFLCCCWSHLHFSQSPPSFHLRTSSSLFFILYAFYETQND